MNSKRYILKNGIILTPFKTIKNHNLIIENGKISKYLKYSNNIVNIDKYTVIDLKGEQYISPGLIDIHTHGGNGEDCIDGNLEIISKGKLSEGITGYLPTLIAAPIQMIFHSFDNINSFIKSKQNKKLPKILGVHLEGIYLNKNYRGAQRLEFLRVPNLNECIDLVKRSYGLLKIMTLAPEINNCISIIELLSNSGIISSIGHSNASNEYIKKAIHKGASHVTHAFNAMGEMGFKEPGVRSPGLEGDILVNDDLTVEVIGELTHLDPTIMEILFRCKGPDKIILITDSLSISGLSKGKYDIGVMTLNLNNENPHIARLEDGSLAGSTIPLIKAVQNFYENTSATLNQAIQMASYNPLRSLKLLDKKGSIEKGKGADIIIFDKYFNVKMVFIEGEIVFES